MEDIKRETSSQFTSRLDRDSVYRTSALKAAVSRAAQDGGIEDQKVDVLILADTYYNWLRGAKDVTESPILEKMKQKLEPEEPD